MARPELIECGASCQGPARQKTAVRRFSPRCQSRSRQYRQFGGRNAGMRRAGSCRHPETRPETTSIVPSRRPQQGCSALNFPTAIVLYVSTPQMPGYRQAAACPRAAQKTATFRSLRSPQWQHWCRRQAQSIANRRTFGGSQQAPAAVRVPSSASSKRDVAKAPKSRNGGARAQLRSVAQQRCGVHSTGGGSPHFSTSIVFPRNGRPVAHARRGRQKDSRTIVGDKRLQKAHGEMVVVYPLEFHRRTNRQWRHRVEAATRSPESDAPPNRGNECCPNCCLPVAKPLVSRYLPGCIVEHHWVCKTCEFGWTSRFQPLLV